MGKDLKGKELGEGLSQRKDGRYSARFLSRSGKRIEKYFKTKKDAKQWLVKAKSDDSRIQRKMRDNMTVTEWYDYYMQNVKYTSIKSNTLALYNSRFEINIKPAIGDMYLCNVKQAHIQALLNTMAETYSGSVLDITKTLLGLLFRAAVDNELIEKSPVTRSIIVPKTKNKRNRVLSVDEQKEFVNWVKDRAYGDVYILALNTGLRCSEIIGLEFSDIDFERGVAHITKQLIFRYPNPSYDFASLKSKESERTIPLTNVAMEIIKKKLEEKNNGRYFADERFEDLVFLNSKGKPTSNMLYDSCIKKYCDCYGVEKFSMHVLRHTFATRCIESGMNPKTLQKILGHANMSMTMDRYVHVSDDIKIEEIRMVENAL